MNSDRQFTTYSLRVSGCLGILLSMLVMITAAAYSGEVKRTSLLVSNLSCNSCLASIKDGLTGLTGVIGMDGDVRSGLVIVDHQPDLEGETIAGTITAMGYPAKVDWTADIDERLAAEFDQRGRFSSGCGGGCGSAGGAAAAPRIWNPQAAQSAKVIRTAMQVAQLSCASCLASIEEEMKTMPGTIGMIGDIRQGMVAVDHLESLSGAQIAAAITRLGYPAVIINNGIGPAGRLVSADTPDAPIASRISSSNCNSRKCSATAAAWKQLYRKYISQPPTEK